MPRLSDDALISAAFSFADDDFDSDYSTPPDYGEDDFIDDEEVYDATYQEDEDGAPNPFDFDTEPFNWPDDRAEDA